MAGKPKSNKQLHAEILSEIRTIDYNIEAIQAKLTSSERDLALLRSGKMEEILEENIRDFKSMIEKWKYHQKTLERIAGTVE
jgi:cob(I)alamin adenosyltransferase